MSGISKKLISVFIIIAFIILSFGAWVFYKNNTADTVLETPEEGWYITQYGVSATGSQRMFYTLNDSEGHLIIIDGGWEADAEEVKKVIAAAGGHVDAWIITHPHPDHVGAFNAIMLEIMDTGSPDITIDKIYATPVNGERYNETANEWDEYIQYEKWVFVTQNMTNITYLNEYDTFSLFDLNFEVFNSWDEEVDEQDTNLCNRGSLMIKVSGSKDSFLFCGDVEEPLQETIISLFGDKLSSTYVQCAHHGNWGLTTDFYELVSPEAAFMDAPVSVIDNTEGTFDGYILKDFLIEKGITVYQPENAPNRVILK